MIDQWGSRLGCCRKEITVAFLGRYKWSRMSRTYTCTLMGLMTKGSLQCVGKEKLQEIILNQLDMAQKLSILIFFLTASMREIYK